MEGTNESSCFSGSINGHFAPATVERVLLYEFTDEKGMQY